MYMDEVYYCISVNVVILSKGQNSNIHCKHCQIAKLDKYEARTTELHNGKTGAIDLEYSEFEVAELHKDPENSEAEAMIMYMLVRICHLKSETKKCLMPSSVWLQ